VVIFESKYCSKKHPPLSSFQISSTEDLKQLCEPLKKAVQEARNALLAGKDGKPFSRRNAGCRIK
jgi:hypothetical protein